MREEYNYRHLPIFQPIQLKTTKKYQLPNSTIRAKKYQKVPKNRLCTPSGVLSRQRISRIKVGWKSDKGGFVMREGYKHLPAFWPSQLKSTKKVPKVSKNTKKQTLYSKWRIIQGKNQSDKSRVEIRYRRICNERRIQAFACLLAVRPKMLAQKAIHCVYLPNSLLFMPSLTTRARRSFQLMFQYTIENGINESASWKVA